MTKAPPMRYYNVVNGETVRMQPDRINLASGHAPPNASCIVVHRGERLVIYPAGSVKAFPLAEQHAVMPGQFGPADLQTLEGPYMPRLLNRALALGNNDKWSLKDFILLGIAGCGTLISLAVLFVVVKAFREAGLL